MNKQVIIAGLLAMLLVPASNGFAGGGKSKIVKNLNKFNSATLEHAVTQGIERSASSVHAVGLSSKLVAPAHLSPVRPTTPTLGVERVQKAANLAEKMAVFQQTGIPIFEGRPLPVKQGLKVLQTNQEKFAAARANREYEEAWAKFQAEKKVKLQQLKEQKATGKEYLAQGGDFFQSGKSYADVKAIAIDVYNFYVKQIGIENIPHVRMVGAPEVEGVVCEIPVDGLSIIRPRPFEDEIELSSEEYIVIFTEKFKGARLVHRDLIQSEEGPAYCVIK